MGSVDLFLVEENSEDSGVAGFFKRETAEFAFSPCISDLFDRPWSSV
jgi:hypothetical protein